MQHPRFRLVATAAALASLGLTGCTETTGGTRTASASPSGTPSLAEQAVCAT
jgi:hypothetical protein